MKGAMTKMKQPHISCVTDIPAEVRFHYLVGLMK